MAAVRIYVEGGGDKREGRRAVRQGFAGFLREFQGVMPAIVACGGREGTHDDFLTALKNHPNDFVILLVDAEEAVVASPRQHLKARDGWELENADDEQVHLMVQAIEAWMIADREALRAYYGHGFSANSLPDKPPEDIPKDDLKRFLDQAGRNTQKKGYNEIDDGTKILAKLDPAVVRKKCPHCRRLFEVICRENGLDPLP